MAEADGGAEGMKGTSRVRAEGMAGFSGACRRGRQGEEADSVIDRTGGDEEHFVLHGTGDIKDSKPSGISDNIKRRGGRCMGGHVIKHYLHFSVNKPVLLIQLH